LVVELVLSEDAQIMKPLINAAAALLLFAVMLGGLSAGIIAGAVALTTGRSDAIAIAASGFAGFLALLMVARRLAPPPDDDRPDSELLI
jgi:hypothetical protein